MRDRPSPGQNFPNPKYPNPFPKYLNPVYPTNILGMMSRNLNLIREIQVPSSGTRITQKLQKGPILIKAQGPSIAP